MFFVVIENIRSAYNIGSIFRTADGLGLDGAIVTGYAAYPPHPKVTKTALGSDETVPWAYHPSALDLLKRLREGNWQPEIRSERWDFQAQDWSTFSQLAAEITDQAQSLYTFSFPKRSLLVFGNEVEGVTQAVLETVDKTIMIPMQGVKDSLNVACTFSIFGFEYVRQQAS